MHPRLRQTKTLNHLPEEKYRQLLTLTLQDLLLPDDRFTFTYDLLPDRYIESKAYECLSYLPKSKGKANVPRGTDYVK